jgi:hypothetical protein
MGQWKNEDEIKAELRAMTDELRKLREGLRDLVSPPKSHHPSREFLHRPSWPAPGAPVAGDRTYPPKPGTRRKKPG